MQLGAVMGKREAHRVGFERCGPAHYLRRPPREGRRRAWSGIPGSNFHQRLEQQRLRGLQTIGRDGAHIGDRLKSSASARPPLPAAALKRNAASAASVFDARFGVAAMPPKAIRRR